MSGKWILCGFLLLLTLTSCATPNIAAQIPSPPIDTPTPASAADSTEQMPKPSSEIEMLPIPTAEMFGLEGLNAALFRAAMEEERQMIAPSLYDLSIARIGILGTYETGDDEIGVICWVETHVYTGYYHTGGEVHLGWGAKPVCISVRQIGENEYQWVNYRAAESGQSDLPGRGYSGSIIEMCEPIEGLAEKILERSIDPEYVMATQHELLDMYCAATATNITVSDWNGFGD